MIRRPVVVVLAALCVVATVLGLSTASASTLPLARSRLTVFGAADRCTPAVVAAPVTTSGSTSTQVVLSGLRAGCAGRAVQLRLWGAGGALAATDTTATLPAGTSATLTVPTYTVSAVRGVALAIGTWGITTTWAPPLPAVGCTVPADPAKTCTVTQVGNGTQWGTPLTEYLRTFQVTTTSTDPVVWQLTFNLSDTSVFPFLAGRVSDQQNGLVLVATSSCSANPRTVTVRGTEGWGEYHTVAAGQARGLELHGYASSAGSPSAQTLLTCP
ncbi:hypothetical protein ACGIF2_06985 [Cellulomonas sp. P22]|uniref:hypothetical protein n=1 Tax=Cellulomonas sp. P22 TaxID=3373189 RepID=UPI00379D8A86